MADEKRKIIQEKVTFGKFSTKFEIFLKIGGNLKQGGNASWSQEGYTPLEVRVSVVAKKRLCTFFQGLQRLYGCQ